MATDPSRPDYRMKGMNAITERPNMHISNPPHSGASPANAEDNLQIGLAALRAARKRRKLFIGAGVAAVLAVGVGLFFLMQGPPAVRALSVKQQDAERVLAVTGRVKPRESVQVFSKTGGQIVALMKDEGDLVKAGDILGQVDAARAKTALTQTEAAVQAQVRTLDQAERDLERARTLLEKGSATLAGVEAATLAVTKGREELRRLTAARDDAKLRLEELSVIAPLDGRILNRPVDPGQVVDTKTTLFEIAPVAAQEVETEVDETLSMSLKEGQTARLMFAGVPQTIEGRVSYLSPEIQTSTGGRIVRLAFDAPETPAGNELPVGLSVDVNIVVARDEAAITIPRTAIRDAATQAYVLTVKDGVLAKQSISFIDWPAANVVVTSGLNAGDKIVTDAKAPPAGTKVEIQG